MIKYILPLLLISSSVSAFESYKCDHLIFDEKSELIEQGLKDSLLVIGNYVLGYTVGEPTTTHTSNIVSKNSKSVMTNADTLFDYEYKELIAEKNGKTLLLIDCKEIQND